MKDKEYLSEQETAKLTGFTIGTLRVWRSMRLKQGLDKGPNFEKSGRTVRYSKAVVEKWLEERWKPI